MSAQNAKRQDRGTILPLAADPEAHQDLRCPPLGEAPFSEKPIEGFRNVELPGASVQARFHQFFLMTPVNTERDDRIRRLRRLGMTQTEIGAMFGLSGARVGQILAGKQSESPHHVGPESPILDLAGLGTRALRRLERYGITTVGQLSQLPDAEMLSWPGFGKTTLNRVRKVLRAARWLTQLLPWVVLMGCTIGAATYDHAQKIFLEI